MKTSVHCSAHQKNLTSTFGIDREFYSLINTHTVIQIDGLAANVSEWLLGCYYAVNCVFWVVSRLLLMSFVHSFV